MRQIICLHDVKSELLRFVANLAKEASYVVRAYADNGWEAICIEHISRRIVAMTDGRRTETYTVTRGFGQVDWDLITRTFKQEIRQ
jgi:hypothetical protein